MSPSTVHIVHCVDTEGPLYESLTATFERLNIIFGIDLKARRKTLVQLQKKEIDLEGLEDQVAKVVDPVLLNYNTTWRQIDEMLEELLSKEFRNFMPDSSGNGWVYNWHCMDHVGFLKNPRRRDLGYHKIVDHYITALERTDSKEDGLHFHHHPVPMTRAADQPATHFFSHTPIVFEIFARRIIERQLFACVHRPGFHTTRPDSHWFLEQYIPFEVANQATDEDYSSFKDMAAGRFGDWRRAPKNWQPYHPSHDDYQVPGQCRRLIARSLNLGTRARLLSENDVKQAFQEAMDGKQVFLSFNHHDFRDMRPDIIYVRDLIFKVSKQFPDVPYKYSEAREAFRATLGLLPKKQLKFDINWDNDRMHVVANTKIFGPQPFLAIKTKSNQFFHDNFDFQIPFREWTYNFDTITYPLSELETIGFAANDPTGNTTVVNIDGATKIVTQVSH